MLEAKDIIGFHLVTDPYSSFSNWAFSPFTFAGKHYTCVEQYMMAQKVWAGRRYDLFEKIMRTADPAEMKSLAGKDSFPEFTQIRAFWEKNRFHIVKRGVKAKFQQNHDMREELLDTGNALLCECAGQDTTWGIGINLKDPSWKEVGNWRGNNYLGIALMEVREELRRGEVNYIDFIDSPTIPEWQLTAQHLKRIPQYYSAIHAYADQLSPDYVKRGFYDTPLADTEIDMRINMGGGLPVAGFYEMKQEVYEIARRMDDRRYLSYIFTDRPKHWGLRGDKYFWADLESRFAFVEVGSINEDEFVQAIHNLYLAKTGQELNADHNAYVKEYAHGGMSSGQVCGNWWVNEGIPMLVERFRITTIN